MFGVCTLELFHWKQLPAAVGHTAPLQLPSLALFSLKGEKLLQPERKHI